MRIAVLTFGILAATGVAAGQLAIQLDGNSILGMLTQLLTRS
jgi:hypothetical protein